MTVGTETTRSSIPAGSEWNSLREEAAGYPSWQAMHGNGTAPNNGEVPATSADAPAEYTAALFPSHAAMEASGSPLGFGVALAAGHVVEINV